MLLIISIVCFYETHSPLLNKSHKIAKNLYRIYLSLLITNMSFDVTSYLLYIKYVSKIVKILNLICCFNHCTKNFNEHSQNTDNQLKLKFQSFMILRLQA